MRSPICASESFFISGSSALMAATSRLNPLYVALVLGADETRDDAVYDLLDVHVVWLASRFLRTRVLSATSLR